MNNNKLKELYLKYELDKEDFFNTNITQLSQGMA